MTIARTSLLLLAFLLATAFPAQAEPDNPGARNLAHIRETQAYHIGTLAYLYGYPLVDMQKQMHNETHRVAGEQPVLAPVNRFYRFDYLVTPTTAGNLRAPNNDTLYFGGWFDLSAGPVIVHAPDTAGRYYTLAVTNFYAEVTHLGRRTTGTGEKYFALVGPGWRGTLPAYVQRVEVKTPHAWILGRMLVDGDRDFAPAMDLVKAFWSVPLADFTPGEPPREATQPPAAAAVNPLGTLEFFRWMNRYLRQHPGEPDEAALMAQFDQIGLGPARDFDPAQLDAATRRGLERAIADGEALLASAARLPQPDMRNGWVFPLGLGSFGRDYLLRASVVRGGYANAPEESTYASMVFDRAGQPLDGAKRYALAFTPQQIPPAGAFWSIAAYDLRTLRLIENPIRRYSIGDRTPGLVRGTDGSLAIAIQRDRPADPATNWLPVSEGPFMLVMRIYEPRPAVFDGSYAPPALIAHQPQP